MAPLLEGPVLTLKGTIMRIFIASIDAVRLGEWGPLQSMFNLFLEIW